MTAFNEEDGGTLIKVEQDTEDSLNKFMEEYNKNYEKIMKELDQ